MADFPFHQFCADEMIGWCEWMGDHEQTERKIRIGAGDLLLAWRYVLRRDEGGCIYVHHWQRSDPDDLHDHPWDFTSVVLRGSYRERRLDPHNGPYVVERPTGSIGYRRALDRHRVEILPGADVWSMIITGPVQREWGFWPGGEFVVGRDYREGEK